jgi:hypothetical protein
MRKLYIYEDQRKLHFSLQAAKTEDGRVGCVVCLWKSILYCLACRLHRLEFPSRGLTGRIRA